jgi:hypothetical protein
MQAGKKCCIAGLTLKLSAIVVLHNYGRPICYNSISKGNSNSHGFKVVQRIECSDFSEVILGMTSPGVAVFRGKATVNEVDLNTLKMASRFYWLKWSRSGGRSFLFLAGHVKLHKLAHFVLLDAIVMLSCMAANFICPST